MAGSMCFKASRFPWRRASWLSWWGENGSGKSTLLRCLAGWAEATEGAVFLEGAPFDTADRRQRRKVVSARAE